MSVHAMTGPWLMVKWIGLAIAATYLVLLVVVFVRFRRDLSRLRRWLIWPTVLGVFISVSVPGIFEDVMFTRICFIAGSIIYVGGIAFLLRGLAEKNHQTLLKAES